MRLRLLVASLLVANGIAAAQKGPQTDMRSAISQSVVGRGLPSATGQRTIEVLRGAGILNVRPDTPFTLSARAPYIDPQTYLSFRRGGLYPERNVIVMSDPTAGLEHSAVGLNWFGNPDRRYIVDCLFREGTGTVRFQWPAPITLTGGRNSTDVSIVDGRAAVVLPAHVESSIDIFPQQRVELSSCDVTPFAE